MKRVEQDAMELALWHLDQPDNGTWESDAHVACRLQWFVGNGRANRHHEDRHKVGLGYTVPGDAGRVRRARRHIDRDDGLFSGYVFGTKTNGQSRKFIRLDRIDIAVGFEALTDSTREQVDRNVQAANQMNAENARQIAKLEADKARFVCAGDVDRAFALHDAINDIKTWREIQPHTLKALQLLGLGGK